MTLCWQLRKSAVQRSKKAYLQKIPAIFKEEMEIHALWLNWNLYILLRIFFVIALVYKYDTGNMWAAQTTCVAYVRSHAVDLDEFTCKVPMTERIYW